MYEGFIGISDRVSSPPSSTVPRSSREFLTFFYLSE